MKNRVCTPLLVVIALLGGTFLWVSLSRGEQQSSQKPGVDYTCPMPEHSDVVMDKPGK